LQVTRAVQCLWAGLGASVISGITALTRMQFGSAEFWGSLVFFVVVNSITAGINLAIGKGWNWARILNIAITLIGVLVLSWVLFHLGVGIEPPLGMAISALSYGLSIVACTFLVTRPARAWFREMKNRA